MEKDEIIKLYIETWNKDSDFLDKAILTISTSTIWLTTISDLVEKINNICYFNLWILTIFFTLILVLLSYVLWIYNSQLWISYFNKWAEKSKINLKMDKINIIINLLRYTYVCFFILWLFILLNSILYG